MHTFNFVRAARTRLCVAALSLALVVGVVPMASAQGGLPGDVNLDGDVNVLDIQQAVVQVLDDTFSAEADLNENAAVDVVDIQNLINSVLGEGGLVQTVTAEVESGNKAAGEQRLIAVSNDGLFAEGTVDPETGEVELDLRTKQGWSLALLVDSGSGSETVAGAVQFPVGNDLSTTLPLTELSIGSEAALGPLSFNSPATVGQDVVDILETIVPPTDTSDADGDGLPDFIQPLLDRLAQDPDVPEEADTDALGDAIAACLDSEVGQLGEPDLADENANGTPDFVEPVLACVEANLATWLDEQNIDVPAPGGGGDAVPEFVNDLVNSLTEAVPDWMAELGNPMLVDENGNGIPDPIESELSVPGAPTAVDANDNGIPDFAEDEDGDGIPNIADDDVPDDADGDGIPDAADVDDDNDGLPDYADDVLD